MEQEKGLQHLQNIYRVEKVIFSKFEEGGILLGASKTKVHMEENLSQKGQILMDCFDRRELTGRFLNINFAIKMCRKKLDAVISGFEYCII